MGPFRLTAWTGDVGYRESCSRSVDRIAEWVSPAPCPLRRVGLERRGRVPRVQIVLGSLDALHGVLVSFRASGELPDSLG
jgi:hypothetical protein